MALLLACLVVPPMPPSPPPLVASMERFPCYGRCPVYSLRVFEDGSLLYHGTRFGEVEGDVQTRLTAGQLQELSLLFTENGYFPCMIRLR